MDSARSSETLVSYATKRGVTTQGTATRRWRQQGPPNRWYPTSMLPGLTAQKTATWRWIQQGPPKRWYPTAILHGVTTQKTATWRWRQCGPPKRWYPTAILHGVTIQLTSTWSFRVTYGGTRFAPRWGSWFSSVSSRECLYTAPLNRPLRVYDPCW
jgi:hypothetical protein